MNKIILFFTLIFTLFTFTHITYSDSIESEVSEISGELMCPVCRGQTVSESNSTLANDFRDIIKRKLEEGETKEEILSYFVERYGESVLASPPAKGIRLVVWLLPLAAIILGFIVLSSFIKSKRSKKIDHKPFNKESNDYLKKVDDEIDSL